MYHCDLILIKTFRYMAFKKPLHPLNYCGRLMERNAFTSIVSYSQLRAPLKSSDYYWPEPKPVGGP